MARVLRIARSAGRYTVLYQDGTVLTSHTGKAAAIEAAIAHLHAGVGGEVIVLSESGGISSRVPVTGSQATTMPTPSSTPPDTVQTLDPRHPPATEAAPTRPTCRRSHRISGGSASGTVSR